MAQIDLSTYQTVFDMIPVGLGIASLEGKLLIYNAAMLAPGGYERADIDSLSSVVELYYEPADRARVLEIARDQGKVDNFRVRFKRKNGEPYWTLMSLRPVQFEGTPGWLASVLDIDIQVRAEEDLSVKMKELEELNKVMVGRELKMAELKEELQKLKSQK
ncbi:MAG: hypothetical protein TR69_WS6001000232 [candidate division WS6 bacterium OLB20]|uniref:PAS domain-containing protein n=1 Tax=candidate division WS6 bacterium OLB20 TaxID=1617426 RepID=A0A136M0F7_9BACT|nr:MAG: hypothetical protein TR69_WS6001000232 [candidate division WS6 bacterium OLB20]